MNIARIREAFPDRRIDYYAALESTMRAAAECDVGAVVIADEQTAGQGRHGHAWHSAAGAGIYCSLVLPAAPVLTLALGLATAEAISTVTGLACDLRWPNDVVLGGKKVAGILVQLLDDKAIAGIGINVHNTSFPPELAAEATSVQLQWKHREPCPTREDILLALLPAVDHFASLDTDTVLRLFTHASSYSHGRRVVVHQPDGILEGTTAGLDPDGFLIVRKDDGTDTLILAGGVRAAGS